MANTGDLARVLNIKELADFREQVRTADDGTAPCTHCRKKMKIVWHHVGQHQVELDSCVRCDVVWFDTGETKSFDLKPAQTLDQRSATLLSREETLKYARALVTIDKQLNSASKRTAFSTDENSLSVGKTLLTFINLPVEEDTDYFESEPWVTWLLIAVCSAVSLFGFYQQEAIVARFAYYHSGPIFSQMVRALSSFFVHADIFHLLGNMYFLWIFGDNVEDELGKGRFVGLVLLATLLGAILFGILDPRAGELPLVGASGGISGLVAFYLVRFPHRRFLTRFFFVWLVPIPGFIFGTLFYVKDIFGAMAELSGGTRVAHLCHLGGALVGLVAAFLLPKKVVSR